LDYLAKLKRVSAKQIALNMKISRRRVQQAGQIYKEGKHEPTIGENKDRPKKPSNERETQVVGESA